MFLVFSKDLRTERVIFDNVFETREEAEMWMEDMMSLYEEMYAYKIEEKK